MIQEIAFQQWTFCQAKISAPTWAICGSINNAIKPLQLYYSHFVPLGSQGFYYCAAAVIKTFFLSHIWLKAQALYVRCFYK